MRTHHLGFPFATLAFLSTIGAAILTTTGCNQSSMSTNSSSEPGSEQSIVSARVMGGRKPISGATIILAEAGTSGKSSSTILATTTSNAYGNFYISKFTCAHAASQLYITASGGDAGSGPNSNILLMAALGPCDHLPSGVVINERSTVAAAYAFAQFLDPSDPTRMGANGPPGTTKYIGITNAGATLATNLVNIATGKPAPTLSLAPNSPNTLNTLADILVYCVNAPSPYGNCDTLFSAVPVEAGGSAPTNTLQAMLDIALSPGQNVATIFGFLSQVPVSLPYAPVLTSAPDSWILALSFSLPQYGSLSSPAIDQAGNVWFANNDYNSNLGIVEFSSTGELLSPPGGYLHWRSTYGLMSLEFDRSGKLWVANCDWYSGQFGSGSIEAMDTFGNVVAGPFPTLYGPRALALDTFGQVWVKNSCGTYSSPHAVTVSKTTGEFSFYVDGSFYNMVADTAVSPNLFWVCPIAGPPGPFYGGLSRITDNGTPSVTVTNVSVVGLGAWVVRPTIDNNGDVWIVVNGGTTTDLYGVEKIHNAATPSVALGPVIVGGYQFPTAITTDSANHVWVVNYSATNRYSETVTELDTNGNILSPETGFTFPAGYASDAAIDRSGNLWLASGSFLVEFIGAAAPVATPRTSGRPLAP